MTVTSAVGHFRITMLHKGFFIFLLALLFTNEINEPKANTIIQERSRISLRSIHLLVCLPQRNNSLSVHLIIQICRNFEPMNMQMCSAFVCFEKLFALLLHVRFSSFMN